MAAKTDLVYALVARDLAILAEYSEASGNFQIVTRLLLAKLSSDIPRMSYSYDTHTYHYLTRGGFMFIVLAEKGCLLQTAYGFLEDIATRFLNEYKSMAKKAIPLSMNHCFAPVLKDRLHIWNASPSGEHFDSVRSKIEDLQSIMIQNIDKLLARGEKIDILVDRAQKLNEDTLEFRRHAQELHRHYWWTKWRFIIGTVTFLCLLMIFVFWH